MPAGLKRYQQQGHYHFITFSCDQRRQYLAEPEAYATLESIIENTRAKHSFHVVGYVFMPEHVHLLVSEPPETPLRNVIKAIKQESSKKLIREREHFWETRYYDFNVMTFAKRKEKLRYIHRNPVKRGLVLEPEDWPWSSFNHYMFDRPTIIQISGERTPRQQDSQVSEDVRQHDSQASEDPGNTAKRRPVDLEC